MKENTKLYAAGALSLALVAGACGESSSIAPGAPPDAGQTARDAGADADPESGAPAFPPPFDPLADSDASLPFRVNFLFQNTTCGGEPENFCHSDGAGSLHLKLMASGDVVGVPSSERPDLLRVKPGDPASSYLYLKVVGDGGIEGGRMPLLQPKPDPRIVTLIRNWILADAGIP